MSAFYVQETFTTTSSDIEVISSPGYSERSGIQGTGHLTFYLNS